MNDIIELLQNEINDANDELLNLEEELKTEETAAEAIKEQILRFEHHILTNQKEQTKISSIVNKIKFKVNKKNETIRIKRATLDVLFKSLPSLSQESQSQEPKESIVHFKSSSLSCFAKHKDTGSKFFYFILNYL